MAWLFFFIHLLLSEKLCVQFEAKEEDAAERREPEAAACILVERIRTVVVVVVCLMRKVLTDRELSCRGGGQRVTVHGRLALELATDEKKLSREVSRSSSDCRSEATTSCRGAAAAALIIAAACCAAAVGAEGGEQLQEIRTHVDALVMVLLFVVLILLEAAGVTTELMLHEARCDTLDEDRSETRMAASEELARA